jgi:anti-sigma B factor antagonist
MMSEGRTMSEDGNREILVTPLELDAGGTDAHPEIKARGEIDVATSPRLRSALRDRFARGAEDITLDLSDVTFIDSSGLGVLVGALKQFRDQANGSGGACDGTLRIVGAREPVRKVFEVTGLSSVFLVD